MSEQITIKINNLCKSFKNNLIFDKAAMTATAGDIIALVGENGSGKSTLLNLLSGIEKADSGEIIYSIEDKPISILNLGDYVSFVPQNNYLLEDLSAYDNLLFWYKGDKKELNQSIEAGIIKELGINDFIRKRISKLSVGMQKRVALACALASNPKVLLLDEVNAPLDIICRLQIRDILTNYAKSGNIIILSTHDEGDIDICNKIYYINDNKINDIKDSSLQEIFKNKL